MSKVLITGSDGFVGSALTSALLNSDYKIVMASRTNERNSSAIAVGDINSTTDWAVALRNCSTVIHLAGRAHVLNERSQNPLESFREINSRGTINLARQAAKQGVKRFVFISSIGVNGNITTEKAFTSSSEPNPHSPYAISKFEAENGIVEICEYSGMEFVIIRPPLIYGANAPGNFGKLVDWIQRGVPLPFASIKDNLRSLVSIENLIDLIEIVVSHPSAANQTFLISDGVDISTVGLLTEIGVALNRPARLFSVHPKILRRAAQLVGMDSAATSLLDSLQVDISNTCKLLNWKPKVSVVGGLKNAFLSPEQRLFNSYKG
ncbi:NAD-dependent epimerase/dehydratase family protein [Chromobacterium piscinae]|uniref:NAD-dependent epimerase/dehydratase family protein n=1 Tax=Chromobacterium piscinae TaxID=686831 RepID=UPI00320B8A96